MRNAAKITFRQDKEALRSVRERGDGMMTVVCWLLWVAAVLFAAMLYGESMSAC